MLLSLCKAIAAVDGTVVSGKERHLRFGAALSADGSVHFTRSTAAVTVGLVGLAAFPAACGLVLEALLGIEFLFACGEREFLAAVTAHQSFVLVHEWYPPEF